MNLINFHKHEKNKDYVEENIIRYCGQGLYNSYWVEPIGNGFNKYLFTVRYQRDSKNPEGTSRASLNQRWQADSKEYKIIVNEKFIVDWTIAANFDEENINTIDTVEFDAFGILETGEYIRLRTNGCNDYDILNSNLKIIDITITNDDPSIQFLTVTHEYEYVDKITKPRYKNREFVERDKNIKFVNNPGEAPIHQPSESDKGSDSDN